MNFTIFELFKMLKSFPLRVQRGRLNALRVALQEHFFIDRVVRICKFFIFVIVSAVKRQRYPAAIRYA